HLPGSGDALLSARTLLSFNAQSDTPESGLPRCSGVFPVAIRIIGPGSRTELSGVRPGTCRDRYFIPGILARNPGFSEEDLLP
ncbi:MAG TPA: hypothetical protein P5263_04680, partial [Methanoregulaceae archaeon]|nr:hypothetical protein [Methanoregulaceae archaeon]